MLTVAVVFLADCEAERSKKHNDVVSILCHLICLIPQMYSSLGTVITLNKCSIIKTASKPSNFETGGG